MRPDMVKRCTSFAGHRRLATGTVAEVAAQTKPWVDQAASEPILIFDDATAQPVEIDFRGSLDEVLRRLPSNEDEGSAEVVESVAPRGPGRPKLGVVAREVTLLPRHWEWLNEQPGGASVALRRLVETARKTNESRDRVRRSQETAYRFLSAMAGNLPGFEEATRGLFACDEHLFNKQIKNWPDDLRDYAQGLASGAFAADNGAASSTREGGA